MKYKEQEYIMIEAGLELIPLNCDVCGKELSEGERFKIRKGATILNGELMPDPNGFEKVCAICIGNQK